MRFAFVVVGLHDQDRIKVSPSSFLEILWIILDVKYPFEKVMISDFQILISLIL